MKEEKPGASMGRGMLTIMWLVVLGGLTLVFARWEDNKYNPNSNLSGSSSGNKRTLTLKQNDWGHYLANGRINGKPVVFLLDTGATNVSIPQHLARNLNLTPGPRFSVNTANGVVQVRATKIASLELGNIIFNDVNASINPGQKDDEILLGMSALKHVEFYQSGRELTITQYTH